MTSTQGTETADARLLDKTVLFGALHATHKDQIFKVLTAREFRENQIVFNEGDPGDALYIVRSGKVAVYTKNEQLGVTLELATLGPGQVFGEMALLTQEKRSASVKALVPTSTYCLSTELFNKIVQQLPAVSLGMAQTLAQRLTQVNKQQGVSAASLNDYRFDPAIYGLVPPRLLQQHKMIPLLLQGSLLTLAMVDPQNVVGLDDIRRVLRNLELKPVAISEDDYARFMREKVGAGSAERATTATKAGADVRQLKVLGPGDGAEAVQDVQGPEVVQLASLILAEGIERGASDIHVDQEQNGVVVRFRVDGQLVPYDKVIPHGFARPLVARFKVTSGMNPTERQLPQDGRTSLTYRGHEYDLRVATMPVKRGERVTMRVLDSVSSLLDIGKLILAPKLAQLVTETIQRPQGLILVTGPTGSGKTTTLYSLLRARMRSERSLNIMTAEDPIEYSLAGVSQAEVRDAVGLSFPRILRGFLRHDPDIIMIGETRDAETARISVQAALTGHLVITSLHTNSAVETITRLLELGVESYLIGSTVSAIVSQRLVRRNCPACATVRPTPAVLLEGLIRVGALQEGQRVELKEGVGCETCAGTGFQGRVGVYEVLTPADSTRALIAANAPVGDIRRDAIQHGMVTLAQYGGFLLKNGLTTAAEVLRVVDT